MTGFGIGVAGCPVEPGFGASQRTNNATAMTGATRVRFKPWICNIINLGTWPGGRAASAGAGVRGVPIVLYFKVA